MGENQYVDLVVPDVPAAVVMKRDSLHRATVGEVIPVNLDAVRAHVFADRGDHAANVTNVTNVTQPAMAASA